VLELATGKTVKLTTKLTKKLSMAKGKMGKT
jgi:hypothetical protein